MTYTYEEFKQAQLVVKTFNDERNVIRKQRHGNISGINYACITYNDLLWLKKEELNKVLYGLSKIRKNEALYIAQDVYGGIIEKLRKELNILRGNKKYYKR